MVVALTFVGLVFNMVITVDPGSVDLSSITASSWRSPTLTHVETVPSATAAAIAGSADKVSSGVAGSASSTARPPGTTAQALTSATAPSPPADHATAESIGTGDSVLARVGSTITAVVSGLIPVVPPVLPISAMRRIAAEATTAGGFNGPEDGSGPAILVLVGLCVLGPLSARRVTDDRARLTWSFVAPLLRPG